MASALAPLRAQPSAKKARLVSEPPPPPPPLPRPHARPPSRAALDPLLEPLSSSSCALSFAHRNKLAVVLDSIDPGHVLDECPGGALSLRQVLALPALSVPLLRSHIARLPPSPNLTAFSSTALALLDDLEPPRALKREAEHDPPDAPPSKYILHRGLPTVDLFSSAVELDEHELALLGELQDTDVIAITTSSLSAPPIPRLGDVNPRPRPFTVPHTARPLLPIPVQPLYYDPFSSFAPSYDSTNATLSYVDSLALLDARDELARWQALPPPSSSSVSSAADELERNRTRIALLLSNQRERLRASARAAEEAKQNGRKLGPLPNHKIGAVEQQTARELLGSLASLVAAHASPRELVRTKDLERQTNGILESVQQDRSYMGALDPTNAVAVRESSMSRSRDEDVGHERAVKDERDDSSNWL